MILFGTGVLIEKYERVLTLFAALATLKIDSLKSEMLNKELFNYYHVALPSQIQSYHLWENTFLASLPTTLEIRSTKFDPHLYDAGDDTLIYIFKTMFNDLFQDTPDFCMDNEKLIIYALTIRKYKPVRCNRT